MFSPLPWKLLDDSSIWTQNWSLTPKLAHGPISTLFSHCTLCPAGCAVKAQCVSGMPFSLSGVASHPLTHGTLCPRGLASHHMAYHPLRIVHPHTFSGTSENSTLAATTVQQAMDTITGHIKNSNGTIAILDQQPNRAVSELYRAFLQKSGRGVYLTSPSREDATIEAIREMMHTPAEPMGYDFENSALIVSFGAPLLDGWGTPGRMTALRNAHQTKFVQIDTRYSRTALQSEQWLAITPGAERTVALSIASVLIEEQLIAPRIRQIVSDFRSFASIAQQYKPETVAQETGIDAALIRSLAREMAHAPSVIVLSGADPGGGPMNAETERAIAALNLMLGSVGKSGGIVARKEIPGYSPTISSSWTQIPDHSIGTLIIDGTDSGYAIPWAFIERKLVKNSSLVITLAPVLDQFSAHADILLPSPAHLESLQDVPSTGGSSRATFALSVPLLTRNENTIEPADVLRELASRMNLLLEIPTQEESLKAKVGKIHSSKRGTLYSYSDGNSTNVSELSSADDLWTALTAGAVWIDADAKQSTPRSVTLGITDTPATRHDGGTLTMIATGWRGTVSASHISPILSKIFQESELRNVDGVVSLNPVTANTLDLTNGTSASLSTANGSAPVTVKIDPTVRPGVVETAIGPALNGSTTPAHFSGTTLLHLCEVANDGTWRITPAQFLKA
jgi:anaerobic selenocysteine-containing dehydrogenase